MSFSLRRKSLSAAMPFPGRALEIPPRCPSPPFQPIKALSPPPARHQRTKSTTTKLAAATHHNVALPGLPIPNNKLRSSSTQQRSGTIDVVVFVSPPPSTTSTPLKSSLKSSTSTSNVKAASLTAPVPVVRRTASYGTQASSPTSTNFSLPSSLRSSSSSGQIASSGPSSPVTQASFLGVPIVPRSSLDSLINTGRHRRMTTSEVRV